MESKCLLVLVLIFIFPLISSAHYITGFVENALDGTSSNDYQIILWNSTNGILDNVTDTIGSNGNSMQDNFYLIDCELLSSPCEIGEILSLKVLQTGDMRGSKTVNVTITSSGYDLVGNITLNSLPVFNSIIVDDSLNFTLNEIDLLTGSANNVSCEAIVEELDGDSLSSISSVFYSTSFSSKEDTNDNNYHYSNSSCSVDSSYGNENESKIVCSFDVYYYAYSDNWNCVISLNDSLSGSEGTDMTYINPLLAISVDDSFFFNGTNALMVSNETQINITNLGNVELDFNISGYAREEGDGYAMNCSFNSGNISIENKKYNLSSSTFGDLTFSEFDSFYTNLSSVPITEDVDFSPRQDDISNDAVFSTYWRIFIPSGISGSCQGNIIIGGILSS